MFICLFVQESCIKEENKNIDCTLSFRGKCRSLYLMLFAWCGCLDKNENRFQCLTFKHLRSYLPVINQCILY